MKALFWQEVIMDYENIIYEKQDRIARITMNRDDNMNALGRELETDLYHAMEDAGADDDIRVVILKGNGRAFSAGAALGGGGTGSAPTSMKFRLGIEQMRHRFFKIWDLPKPVIAQVHGYALANGSVLALICDLTIAADDALFGGAQAPLGAGAVSPIWLWNIGMKKTKEYFLPIGNRVTGKEAERIGLINKAVPADKLEEEVNTTAQYIARTPLEVLALQKLTVNRIMEFMGLRASMLIGSEIDTVCHTTEAVNKFGARMREVGISAAMKEWRGNTGPLAGL
jgi:enoyl-CoA hydratase